MAFDIIGAKNAGYSDTEIADYLSSQNGFDAAGARKAGYSDQEIIGHVSGSVDVGADKPKEKSSLLRRAVGDTAISALKGAIDLPEAFVGLADIATGGRVGQAAESLGYKPKEAKSILDTLYSPEQQEANANVAAAKGFIPTVKAALQNPSTIVQSAVESAPSMIGAAGIARGGMRMIPKLGPVVAGALGEGAMSAGQTAEQIREESPTGRLTPMQGGISAASGAATAGLGIVGGRIAQKLGITDIDTFLASGAPIESKKAIVRSVVEGIISEGALEELPQSAQEQAAQNIAQGKPWDEGVAEAAASGMIVGGVMGGGGNVIGHGATEAQPAPSGPLSRAVGMADTRAVAPVQSIGSLVAERRGLAQQPAHVAQPVVKQPALEVAPAEPVISRAAAPVQGIGGLVAERRKLAENQGNPDAQIPPVAGLSEPVDTSVPPTEPEVEDFHAFSERRNRSLTEDRQRYAEMTRDELFAEKERMQEDEDTLEERILGPDLNAWRKAQRLQGSRNEETARNAENEIERIESKLPKRDRDRLYGMGEVGHSADDLSEYLNAMDAVDGDTPDELASSLKFAITKLNGKTDPADMDSREFAGYLQMREGMQKAVENGWDTADISDKVIKAAASRFADPEDALYMLKAFIKKQPPAPARQRELAAPPLRLGTALSPTIGVSNETADEGRQDDRQYAQGTESNADGEGQGRDETALQAVQREGNAENETGVAISAPAKSVTAPDFIGMGYGNEEFPAVLESAKAELAKGNADRVTTNKGEVINLVHYDDGGAQGESRILALNDNGELVGDLEYSTGTMENGRGFNPQIDVAEPYRRKGVATALYDAAESRGGKIPALDEPQVRTPDGQAFREARAGQAPKAEAPATPADPDFALILSNLEKQTAVEKGKGSKGNWSVSDFQEYLKQSYPSVAGMPKVRILSALRTQAKGKPLSPVNQEVIDAFRHDEEALRQKYGTIEQVAQEIADEIDAEDYDSAADFFDAIIARNEGRTDEARNAAEDNGEIEALFTGGTERDTQEGQRKAEATDDAGGWQQEVAVSAAKKVPTIGGAQKQGGRRQSTSDLMDGFTPEPPSLFDAPKYALAHQETHNFKRWSNNAPLVTSAKALEHEFKSGQKVVVEAFHGTARPDRVGTKFLKKRATSGPMSFFTSNPELASGYAQGKQDTSLANEDTDYPNWFKYKPKGSRSTVGIDRAWYFLPSEIKQKIIERMKDIRTDDDGNIIYEEGGGDIGSYEWELKQTQRGYDRVGNPLKAAVETWLMSGSLFNQEEDFMKVLELAGFPVEEIKYDPPHAAYPFVYKVYVAMQSPLVTDDIPQNVIDALHEVAKRDRTRAQRHGADMWDKNTRTLKDWVGEFDREENQYVWTSIPDKVTEVFKSLGYDGIIDVGGKGGGEKHKVYIPFEETQVKSAIGNKGTYDPTKNDIRYSTDEKGTADLTLERVQSSFPSLSVTEDNGAFTVTTPSGIPIRISKVGEIEFGPEQRAAAEKEYGRPLRPDERPAAEFKPLDHGAIINLTDKGVGELDHEAFHAAMSLALTAKQQQAVLRTFGNEEKAAAEYQRLKESGALETRKGNYWLAKIYRFLRALRQLISPTAKGVMEDVASGKVWGKAHAGDGGARYAFARADQIMTPEQKAAVEAAFGTPPTMMDRAKAFKKDLGKNLVQGVLDQYAPIKDIDMGAYMKARMTKGADSTLEAVMLYGKPYIDSTGSIRVEFDSKNEAMNGFATILAELDGEHDRFLKWVAGIRAARLKDVGLENLMSKDTIKALKSLNRDGTAENKLPNGEDRAHTYMRVLNHMNAYNDAILKVAVERGLINDATRQMYKDMPYIPFYRLQDEGVVSGFTVTSGLVNQTAWKKLKGGTNKLNDDMLANMLKNWSHLITASARNEAAAKTLTKALELGAAHEVPAGYPGKGIVSFRENTTTVLKKDQSGEYKRVQGEPLPIGTKYKEGGVDKVSDGTMVPEFNVERHFIVTDPHLLDAITSIGQVTKVPKPLRAFKNILAHSVTINPTFKIRNLIRDSISSIALADLSYNPAENIAKGYKLTAKDSETRAQMLTSGGIMRFGSMLDGANADNARKLIDAGVPTDHILDSPNKVAAVWKKYVVGAFDAYQEFGDRGEQVNRAALYQSLLDKGYTPDEAAFWARDLMDFSMSGKWAAVRFLSQTVPFMNARLQGMYKLGRSAKADKKRFGYVIGGVALASLALLGAYHDDDDWQKREAWDRDNYWWFKIGDKAFRIPKPFEIGAIGSVAEWSAELMFNREMTGKKFAARIRDIVSSQLSMNPTPQIVKPLIDLWANKDSFTQRPIEGMGMDRLKPEDRFNDKTSGVAKILGQLGMPNPAQVIMGRYEGLSPVQIDFMIRGYFSWLGSMATTALDYGIFKPLSGSTAPAMQLKDTFMVGNFVESLPSNSSRYISEMYDNAREIEQSYNSYRNAIKSGDRKRAAEIMSKDKENIQKHGQVERLKETVADLNRQIKRITASSQYSADQKRTMIDKLKQRQGQIAKTAMQRQIASTEQ